MQDNTRESALEKWQKRNAKKTRKAVEDGLTEGRMNRGLLSFEKDDKEKSDLIRRENGQCQ